MRILFLTPTFPYPLDNGNRILEFNTIKQLSKNHQIFLLSLIQEGQHQHLLRLKEYCTSIETVPVPEVGLWGKEVNYSKLGLVKSLFNPIPYNLARWYSLEMENKLKKVLSRNTFDLVQIETLHMAPYARFYKNSPVILRQHNVESKMMERYYKNASDYFERIFAFLQWRKLLGYERKMCLDSDLVITLSRIDEDDIKRLSSEIKTEVLSIGVDGEYFKPKNEVRKENQILYLGNLGFPPVRENVLYFLSEIWPIIKQKCPDTKFLILGNRPRNKDKIIRKFPDVVFLGEVEDIRPYMDSSCLTVVPHRIASGVRFKILEAMAMKLPVVSTSIGCEGLNVADGENILVADSPLAFARQVVNLLENDDLRISLADKAYALVKDKYTWQNVGQRLNRIYENLQMGVNGKNNKENDQEE
jgi:glycosyltransferase involved in cell wall biosynthesis